MLRGLYRWLDRTVVKPAGGPWIVTEVRRGRWRAHLKIDYGERWAAEGPTPAEAMAAAARRVELEAP